MLQITTLRLVLTALLIISTSHVMGQESVKELSAEEIAAELANPNTPMATMTLRTQYRAFDGDLPNAGSQSSTTMLFQPSLPFPLANGDSILFRPAIPIQLDFPSFNPADLDFESESGLGDIVFDVAYARTSASGILTAAGVVVSLPTATEDALGTDRLSMGPEFMIGKLSKKYVVGIFPNHQWDVGGGGDAEINVTTIQLFGTYLPGGGWNLGTSPIITLDHETDQWTIPVNFTAGKTVIWNGKAWKISGELNYYVEKSDTFGAEWFLGFNIGPVVENSLASWFK